VRLRSLYVSNYGCIDEQGYEVEIDDIVILIGANNVGKSTILDAYEAFASVGAALPLESFRGENPGNTVRIAGTFTDLSQEDVETLGKKWKYTHARFGDCVRVMWQWKTPDAKGEKFSWDPSKGDWVPGGMGGWDTLIASRVPLPLRVRPTDDAATTEAQVAEILVSAAKAAIKADQGKTAGVIAELEKLTADLAKGVEAQIQETVVKISQRLAQVFPGHSVYFSPQIGKFDAEKVLGAGSHIRIEDPSHSRIPLSQQGAGLRRTFLWAALGALADVGRIKQGRSQVPADRQRILLLEEPESFLHPPMVRAAREALYGLATIPEWQVMATTHSPVFIDVAKPHTTIVRIGQGASTRTRVFSTDRASFSEDERENLVSVRACNPEVNEFFFAEHAWLVEGETEAVALSLLRLKDADAANLNVVIVNCLGKANIPLFMRILNQFGTPYTVIHDSDAPRCKRKDKWQTNPMWTVNQTIRETLEARSGDLPKCMLVVSVPDFEWTYYGFRLGSDKPYTAISTIQAPSFATDSSLERLRTLVPSILNGTHPFKYSSADQLRKLVAEYVKTESPSPPEEWNLDG